MQLHTEVNIILVTSASGWNNIFLYQGMITSAILWGFCSDILGRKKLLVYGYLLDGFFNILCAFSTSFVAISIFKFIGGFMWVGSGMMIRISQKINLIFAAAVYAGHLQFWWATCPSFIVQNIDHESSWGQAYFSASPILFFLFSPWSLSQNQFLI